ncbi:MAG: CPBP family intramembrane metalloprotease [Fuerstia sp.]|nr:CPBP family intramembrane metalloprotease [Fuerstiella sp.]
MMSFLNPILAQAVADPEKVTVGTVITAMMFLMAAAGSMAMIVAWVIRYNQTGHALPAARRGVLRVPWPLTLVAAVLSVLLMVLVLTSSFVDPVPVIDNIVPAKPAEVEIRAARVDTTAGGKQTLPPTAPTIPAPAQPDAEKTNSATEPSSSSEAKRIDGSDATSTSKKTTIDPDQMKSSLIQTLVMDFVMLLAFGTVILVAGKAGRVYLQDSKVPHSLQSGPPGLKPKQATRAVGAGMGFGTPWPDLDDASSIPQLPGYDILGNRGVNERGSTSTSMTVESPNPTASPTSWETAKPVEHNPFAVVREDERFGTDPIATLPATAELRVADEPFSFTRELRFAAEVFLAAYLPTTALRLLIVLISIGIVGEPPDSHPFLEMLKAGVSVPMIVMILVVAVFVAPIVEELQFRVVILGGIAQLGKPVLALIASSILFAFAHGFPDSIALIPLALALGYAYLRRRSYVTVMLVHFLFNGFNMILALVALI